MSEAEISGAYKELMNRIEEFLNELRSCQEQQRIEEEEAVMMRKLKEEQVRGQTLSISSVIYSRTSQRS